MRKTTVLLSLLLSKNRLKFQNIYIYSKSLYQAKYEFLRKVISGIPEINLFEFDNNHDVVQIEDALPFSIAIFDDIACEKQKIVADYYSRGRHKSIDCFYLCQSYAKVPKHLIRDNSNFLILFNQDTLNLENIHKSHVNSDFSFTKFTEICRECWRNPFDFLLIDKSSGLNSGRYRYKFNNFIISS